jgi:hypothetical protein
MRAEERRVELLLPDHHVVLADDELSLRDEAMIPHVPHDLTIGVDSIRKGIASKSGRVDGGKKPLSKRKLWIPPP